MARSCFVSTRRPGVRRNGACGFQSGVDQDALSARVLWRAEHDPGVVTIDALPARAGDPDSLDVRTAGIDITFVAARRAPSQLLLSQGPRHIRLAVREGSLLDGPVRLRYALEGLATLEPRLLTLRRLAALWRLGRMPAQLFPPDPRASRWIEMLRTLDALRLGASQQEIARALVGAAIIERDWRSGSDYLRSRVQRLVRSSQAMADRDYLRLLGGPRAAGGPGVRRRP